MKTIIDQKGKEWHREIDNLVMKLKLGIDEMDSKHHTVLNKQEADTE